MKKIVSLIALVLLLAGAFFVLQHRQAASRVRAVTLAPGGTLLFVHLPDLRRTGERWPHTSLNQLLREPEVEAFLEKPKSKLPWMAESHIRMEQFAQALPREAFVAVTSFSGSQPTFVAGLCFDGNRTAIEELLADARQNLRKARPAGKADIVSYAGAEIETYTDKDAVVAETFRDNWYFVANELELLQTTIDRYDGKKAKGEVFADNAPYVKSMAALPSDADLVLFAQVRVLADRFATLLATAGQGADASQLAALQQAEALAASVKFDGALMRDTIFVLAPQTGQPTPLARRSLALTTANTLLYYTGAMGPGADIEKTTAPLAAMVPALADLEKALASEGLKISDFAEIFGPETSAILDWPKEAAQPSFTFTLDVRDAERAEKFLQAVTAGTGTQPEWTRREEKGAVVYAGPAVGMLNVAPVVGMSRDFLVLGLSPETVMATLNRPAAGAARLDQGESYRHATKLVVEPTSAFAYLDTRTVFERVYGVVRPFLAMSMAFSPEAGQYVDAGKLPTTDVIIRHLGPSTFSQKQVENGIVIESAGTLTLNQAVLGTAVGIGVAALPAIQQMTKGGGFVPPGFAPPGAPSLPPAAPVSPAPSEPPPAQETEPAPPVSAPAGPLEV